MQAMIDDSEFGIETLIQRKALYEYRHPFPKSNSKKIHRLSKLEYNRMMDSDATPRQKLFMEIIHRLDLRITQACSLKRDSPIIPPDLLDKCEPIFGKGIFLMETGNGYPYERRYITKQIKRVGKKILGIDISAESLRPKKYRAGRTDLDG